MRSTRGLNLLLNLVIFVRHSPPSDGISTSRDLRGSTFWDVSELRCVDEQKADCKSEQNGHKRESRRGWKGQWEDFSTDSDSTAARHASATERITSNRDHGEMVERVEFLLVPSGRARSRRPPVGRVRYIRLMNHRNKFKPMLQYKRLLRWLLCFVWRVLDAKAVVASACSRQRWSCRFGSSARTDMEGA